MSLNIIYSNHFKKDLKKIEKQGKNNKLIDEAVEIITNKKIMPREYFNHKLNGEYPNCKELHIKPNWLLIYKETSNDIHLLRTGTHSQLFRKN